MRPQLTRREWMALSGKAALAVPFSSAFSLAAAGADRAAGTLSKDEEQLLEEIERAAFRFFWEQGSSRTGQIKDRCYADGSADKRTLASIASTGFGLAGLCIAAERGYQPRHEITARVKTTLKFLRDESPHEHGFFYHFSDMETGVPARGTEVSTIDTSILLCGILTCRAYFKDQEISALATRLYERVDWPWFLNGGSAFSMGWHPHQGFLASRWDKYCELMMIYLLAIGSPTHPVPASCWNAFSRPWFEYHGLHYINIPAPLFIHQYSHAWFDFRHRHDRYADYFANSVLATRAHKQFCLSLHDRFSDYSDNLWGITASDSQHGYVAWGGPPENGPIDGTVVPCAPAGSLPFWPSPCMAVLRHIRDRFGSKVWKRYGFVDAFNPLTGWIDPDVIGIDVGITMLMAENLRSGFVWSTFMRNPEAEQAMRKVGFVLTKAHASG